MKQTMTLSAISLALLFSLNANAQDWDKVDGTTCASKQTALNTQLEYAKNHNNVNRVRGLEKALDDVNRYCSNDKLEEKYKNQVKEKRDELAKREQELREAELKGDSSKIAKQSAKLDKDRTELSQAENKLSQFYQDLNKKP